jgi:SAM-dependent methyltransferase
MSEGEGDGDIADRALSFGSVAALYDEYRPGVPNSFNEYLELSESDQVIELAAGTGLITRTLEKSGAAIIAVEPDREMLAQLLTHPTSVAAVLARAEALPFRDQCVDLILIMSAWHWLDARCTFEQSARVLRDDGRLVIGWNGADQRVDWVKELFSLRRSLEGENLKRHDADGVDVTLATRFDRIESTQIEWRWTRTRDQLIHLFLTYSGVITLDQVRRESLMNNVTNRVDAVMNGAATIELPMSTRLWRARRIARDALTNELH